jgi:hypothetical protein
MIMIIIIMIMMMMITPCSLIETSVNFNEVTQSYNPEGYIIFILTAVIT